MTIEINDNHINRAFHSDGEWDPIQIALCDLFPEFLINVGIWMIKITTENGEFWAEMPEKAIDCVAAFDRQDDIVPFSFELQWRKDGNCYSRPA